VARKTIMVLGNGVPKEAVASGAITPGHLLERTSAAVDTVKVHATAGGEVVPKLFAREDDLQGNEISEAYATGNTVLMNVALPGDEVLCLLKNGENVTKGDFLESAGDGTLQKFVADSGAVTEKSNQIVGVALESVDMSDSSAADPSGRILVEIC
jgi:hypothetical protein